MKTFFKTIYFLIAVFFLLQAFTLYHFFDPWKYLSSFLKPPLNINPWTYLFILLAIILIITYFLKYLEDKLKIKGVITKLLRFFLQESFFDFIWISKVLIYVAFSIFIVIPIDILREEFFKIPINYNTIWEDVGWTWLNCTFFLLFLDLSINWLLWLIKIFPSRIHKKSI